MNIGSENYPDDSVKERGQEDILTVAGDMTAEGWLEFLMRSLEERVVDGIELPGFPDKKIQEQFVGSSGERTLLEAFRFYSIVQKYLVELDHTLTRESTVLDFGCGWGRILRFFLRDVLAENLYGLDVDPTSIDFCRKNFNRVNFAVTQPHSPTSLPDNTLDLIFGYSVFSHLSEEVGLGWVKDFSRILKPNGLLFATTHSYRFIEQCRSFRDNPSASVWHKALANSYFVTPAALADYEQGRPVFNPTGGGDFRPSSFYGDMILPEPYVKANWTRYLTFVDFVDDQECLPQALIVMQK